MAENNDILQSIDSNVALWADGSISDKKQYNIDILKNIAKNLAAIAGQETGSDDYRYIRDVLKDIDETVETIEESGGGSGVTVEPLSVTENGTYTAPSGKAYSPVSVEVPGLTKLTTTYTPAESSTSGEIPLPSNDMPVLVLITTTTVGTGVSDFASGEIIASAMAPATPGVNNVDIHRRTNGGYSYKHLTSGYLLAAAWSQEANATYAPGSYAITGGKLLYRVVTNAAFLAGVTYDVECYYLAGGNGQ